jgi:FixJ family two-component response regulator
LNTTSRVDRSYIADRNRAILDQLQRGTPLTQIAQHFGLDRRTVKNIAFNARTFPNADLTYLANPYAKPYSAK